MDIWLKEKAELTSRQRGPQLVEPVHICSAQTYHGIPEVGEMGHLKEAITKIEGNGKAQKKAYK